MTRELPKSRATVVAPAGAKRRRLALEAEIRDAFGDFLDACRTRLATEAKREELDEDLKTVAKLLERKAKRESMKI